MYRSAADLEAVAEDCDVVGAAVYDLRRQSIILHQELSVIEHFRLTVAVYLAAVLHSGLQTEQNLRQLDLFVFGHGSSAVIISDVFLAGLD